MTLFYQMEDVAGSLFLYGQIIGHKIEDAEPAWATKNTLERILSNKHIEKFWIELD